MTAALGAGPLLLAPLWLAGRPFGALAVAARRGRAPFLGEELRLVQSFATHASVALEHGRSEEERRHLAVLEERERIGRELHDSVISSLFATGLSLYGCQALTSDERLRSRLEVAVDDLDATIGRLRTTIFPVA